MGVRYGEKTSGAPHRSNGFHERLLYKKDPTLTPARRDERLSELEHIPQEKNSQKHTSMIFGDQLKRSIVLHDC